MFEISVDGKSYVCILLCMCVVMLDDDFDVVIMEYVKGVV